MRVQSLLNPDVEVKDILTLTPALSRRERVIYASRCRLMPMGLDPQTSSMADELYEPTSGTFVTTGSPMADRSAFTATLLLDGTVLVIGGTAELYHRATGTFTAARPLLQSRGGHTATRLLDGHVLVAGGYGPDGSGASTSLTSAELYY